MSMIKDCVALLGLPAKDKVTAFTGTMISVNFDLFGCVQFCLKPTVDKDEKDRESQWFDINRLEIQEGERCMPLPDFMHVKISKPQKYDKGAASGKKKY